MTLLDKAKSAMKKMEAPPDTESIDLAIAWLKGDINTRQVCIAYGLDITTSSGAMYRIAKHLKEAYECGLLKIDHRE